MKELNDNDDQAVSKTADSTKKKIFNKKWLKISLILIIIGGLLWTGIWWCNNKTSELEKQKNEEISQLKKEQSDLEKQLTEEKAKAASLPAEESSCKTPSITTVDNIKDSITSGNTAALEGYMGNKVIVILAASEGLGDRTPAQAVGDITGFINGAGAPWNFTLSAATIDGYSAGFYGKYFPDGSVAGKSADNRVISFSFDCSGKIKTVFYTPDASLL